MKVWTKCFGLDYTCKKRCRVKSNEHIQCNIIHKKETNATIITWELPCNIIIEKNTYTLISLVKNE